MHVRNHRRRDVDSFYGILMPRNEKGHSSGRLWRSEGVVLRLLMSCHRSGRLKLPRTLSRNNLLLHNLIYKGCIHDFLLLKSMSLSILILLLKLVLKLVEKPLKSRRKFTTGKIPMKISHTKNPLHVASAHQSDLISTSNRSRTQISHHPDLPKNTETSPIHSPHHPNK